ncbi:hypothetical protein ACQ4PT_059393 [Festuca glaucescens]
MQMVVRKAGIEDIEPLRFAAMTSAPGTSSWAADDDMSLANDDLLDAERVALQLEAHRRQGAYLEAVIERSRRKSELLQGQADAVLRAERLEEELRKQKRSYAHLQQMFDGTCAEYRNTVQDLTAQKDELLGKNKTLRRERKELKDSVGHLEGSLDDWTCAFYREKAKREEVTRELEVLYLEFERENQLRRDGKSDLLTCLQSLRRLNDEVEMLKQSLKEMTAEDEALKKSLRDLTVAGTPVAEMFEPTTSGEEPWPLVDCLRDMPDKILAFMPKMVRSIPQQVLSFVKSFYPTAKLELVGDGMAVECTKEKFEELMQQMAPVAERVAEWISLQ